MIRTERQRVRLRMQRRIRAAVAERRLARALMDDIDQPGEPDTEAATPTTPAA
jgi:hypothetical protein